MMQTVPCSIRAEQEGESTGQVAGIGWRPLGQPEGTCKYVTLRSCWLGLARCLGGRDIVNGIL